MFPYCKDWSLWVTDQWWLSCKHQRAKNPCSGLNVSDPPSAAAQRTKAVVLEGEFFWRVWGAIYPLTLSSSIFNHERVTCQDSSCKNRNKLCQALCYLDLGLAKLQNMNLFFINQTLVFHDSCINRLSKLHPPPQDWSSEGKWTPQGHLQVQKSLVEAGLAAETLGS